MSTVNLTIPDVLLFVGAFMFAYCFGSILWWLFARKKDKDP